MEKGKILVVDDEVEIANEISAAVSKAGFEAEAVNSGKEALDKIKAGHFDVVLLDIRMPGLSGIEVLEQIKKLTSRPDIIMLTALDEAKIAFEASRLGATDYITKPFDRGQLILRISAAINRRKEQEITTRKLSVFGDVFSKGKLGGINAHRMDMCTELVEKRGGIANIQLEELEEIADGKWDSRKLTDIS